MTFSRTIGLSIAVALAACKGRSAATAAAQDAQVEAAASGSVEVLDASAMAGASASAGPVTPPMHRRGLTGMFFRAAQDVGLSDDQKTAIGKLEEPLQSDPGARREMSALRADLVASVRDGKIDAAKIAADKLAIAKGIAARDEEQATALTGLHEALTPAQRGAVADAVRTARERLPPGGPPAGGPDWTARRLEHMKSQLVLDADQQKQVAAVLARAAPTLASSQAHFDATKKQTEAVAAAFEKDTFDAKKLDLSAAPGKKASEPFDRQIKYIAQLLPILTAGQRERFAGVMEHPRDHGGRGDSITDAPDPSAGPGR